MSQRPATARELFDFMGPVQEKKGFFFNSDKQMVLDLLEQLLATKERYGYMACPCRFANGEYAKDKDIICPCTYRAADVAEYGACYCGLYVSEACIRGEKPLVLVPERRPPENILF